MVNIRLRSIFALLVSLGIPAFAGAVPAAEVAATVRGALMSLDASGDIRILEPGAGVATGDILSTSKGLAVLRLGDGTLVTLRPNTSFSVDAYSFSRTTASARLNLRAGGVRVLSGGIGARNPRGLVLVTPEGIIHPHGTDFEARICNGECEAEASSTQRNRRSDQPEVAARVVFLRGRATAEKTAGRTRTLALGGSLVEKETLRSAKRSVVAIAFRDGQRATLQADTSIVIERYPLEQAAGLANDARVRLLKGGMRLLAGLKEQYRSVAMTVTTATGNIEVASEGVDLSCTGTCASAAPTTSFWRLPSNGVFAVAGGLLDLLVPSVYARSAAEGLVARPWGGGEVVVTSRGGASARIGSGGVLLLSGSDAVPVQLPAVPASMSFAGVPRPDLPESVDPSLRGQVLFGGIRQDQPKPGLYLRVTSGDATFIGTAGDRVDLGPGESAFSGRGGTGAVRLGEPPALLEIPSPNRLVELAPGLNLPGSGRGAELEALVDDMCLSE